MSELIIKKDNKKINLLDKQDIIYALNDKVTWDNLSDELINKADTADIPSNTSDLNNDSGFLTSHQDISGKENTSNKVTSLSNNSTDTQYPTAKCVYDEIKAINDLISDSITYINQ